MDKGLREFKNHIWSVISTIETFGGLKLSLRLFLIELKADQSKQSLLNPKKGNKQ